VKGGQLLHVTFASDHEKYAWLNGTVCVAEGVIDAERMSMHLDVFLCVSELG
jgi:hypothetical protein